MPNLDHIQIAHALKFWQGIIVCPALAVPVLHPARRAHSVEQIAVLAYLSIECHFLVTALQVNHGDFTPVYVIRICRQGIVPVRNLPDMLKFSGTCNVPVIHDTILAAQHEHLDAQMFLSAPLDAHHVQVDKFLLLCLVPDDDRPFANLSGFPSNLSREHLCPVPLVSWQSESLVQTNLVKDGHAFLSLADAHTASHLLQVLRERQCGTCQLYELHFGEIHTFAQDVYIHANLYPVRTIILNQPLPFCRRRISLNPAAVHAMALVIFCNMSGMFAVNGIDDTLLTVHIPLVGIVEMLDAFRYIHHRCHLLRLIVAISPTLLQARYPLHHQVIRTGRNVVEVRQPSLVDELLYGP